MRQKRKKISALLLCAFMALGLSQSALAAASAASAEQSLPRASAEQSQSPLRASAESQAYASPEQSLKIAVMSDPHILAPQLVGDPETNEDYANALASDRKMLSESAAILDEAIEMIVAGEPDVLIVPGDLTKDGELASHEYFAGKLNALRNRLPALKIYVTNGNHDINNKHAFDYSNGFAKCADGTSPEEYRELYAGLGFADETIEYYVPKNGRAGANSYATRPAEGFTVISVDSCKYTSDVTPSGEDVQVTGGVIAPELIDWILAKTAEAKAAGDEVIVFQHHGTIPHYSMQTTIAAQYLLDNWETVGKAYANAGIRFVFTGHGHAQSVVKADYDGNILYDVETNSLVTYPSPIRFATVTKDGSGSGSVDIRSDYVERIVYKGETIENFTDYGRGQVGSDTLIPSILSVSGGLVADLIGEDGSLSALENALLNGGSLSEYAISMLSESLGRSEETGMALPLDGFGLTAAMWYDAENERVTVTISSDSIKTEMYMTAENIEKYIVRSCFSQLDEIIAGDKITAGDDYDLSKAITRVIDALGRYQLDETHDFYDLAAYAYQTNIDGTSGKGLEPWARAALEMFVDENAVKFMMNGVLEQFQRELMGTSNSEEGVKGLLEQIEINYGDGSDGLFTYSANDEVISEIYPLITGFLPNDVAGLLEMFLGDNIFDLVVSGEGEEGEGGETLDDMLSGLVSGLIRDLLVSFMAPDGELDNNNTRIEWNDNIDPPIDPPPFYELVVAGVETGAESDASKPIEYAVSLEGAKDVSVVTLIFQADGNMLDVNRFEAQNGFSAMSDDIAWTHDENMIYTGRLTLVYTPFGENFTAADKTEILRIYAMAKQLGETTVKLVDAVIVEGATDGEVEWKFDPDEAKTDIVEVAVYSIYDLNRDTFVDEKDLSIVLGYFLISSGEPEWEYARAADFGGTEGEIDLVDITAVYANFT